MKQAINGQIPEDKYKHDPTLQNKNKQTVALILASRGIIPPRYWNHDIQLEDNDKYTVVKYLRAYKLPIPNYWITDNDRLNKPWFQQAIYDEMVVYKDLNPGEQNDDGFTIAMIQAINGKLPEERFIHDPNIKNKYGQTVEDIMTINNIIIPDYWRCKPVKQQKENEQVQEQQKQQETKIEENENKEQKDEPKQNSKQIQQFSFSFVNTGNVGSFGSGVERDSFIKNDQIQKPEIIDKQHDEKQQDKIFFEEQLKQNQKKQTDAMKLAQNGIIPPKEQEHKPELQDENGLTVAMYLAKNKIIPSKQWQHDPNIKDKNGKTVEDYLKENNINIPNEWKTQ